VIYVGLVSHGSDRKSVFRVGPKYHLNLNASPVVKASEYPIFPRIFLNHSESCHQLHFGTWTRTRQQQHIKYAASTGSKVLKVKSSKDSKDNRKRLIARANIEQIQPGDYLV